MCERSFFGRRQGRALSPARKRALDKILPQFSISPEELKESHNLDPAQLFPDQYKEYWLEIGFGHGEHLLGLSQRHPQSGFIGAEPYISGMSSFLQDAKKLKNSNMKVLMDDGMIVSKSLIENSLNGICILNPDPWHKKRHHKRRIINQQNLDVFAKILKSGGQLILTSDVTDLVEWMCLQTFNHPAFKWIAQTRTDWSSPPQDWITTRYETKGAKGAKKMVYLFFERL